jgi:signal transduction histidine kinase
MRGARTDVLIAVAGALGGVGAVLLWGAPAEVVPAVALGAALGLARRFPTVTWLLASAILLAVGIRGEVPGGDGFVTMPLAGAHAVFAGRFADRWSSYAALAALGGSAFAGALLASDSPVPYLLFVGSCWGAGRALSERERVAAQLSARARELEEERDAYAALSVRYERARIASELHDIVAHAISVMVVQASAGQRLAHDPEATAETFEAIAGAARQAEQDMGRLVALLGDEGAIGPAPDLALVEELVGRAAGSGLDVKLRLEGEREGLPAELAETAYRVVQEGLTNALRYAAGASVAVRVKAARDDLLVEVENDGSGQRESLAGVGTGNGLRGLRERVDACGGRLEAGPLADGWLLSARLPRRRQVAHAVPATR